ncbi:MAG: NAD/NADP octopine/nopaline dehydrogenase family protein [Candidatus Bipolaricaulota bacterium]|nr:MAG: NAD/NADP octopine/nopaline dehydrogenase family protein [Candidatus Bipolaricaulota bacterium]
MGKGKVAVLGAGSGGFMSAADLGQMGYEVALFSRNIDKVAGVKATGGIEILDIDSNPTGRFGEVACATDDIAEAVKGAKVILNPIPYFVCEEYARLVAPHLEDGQVVLYLGKGGASLTWARVLRELGIDKKVYLADCNTLPYGASRKGDAQVRLENRTQNLIIATFPGKDIDHVIKVAEELYPAEHGYTLRAGQNAIDSILVDYNAITHTPPMVCNAARIESGSAGFCLFGKAENTPAVVRIIEKIDRERMAIGEKLGLKQYTLEEEIMMVKWNPAGEDYVLPLYDAIHTPFLEVCEGPFSLDVRHLTEDIPYGLVTFSSLGRLLGVPTPFTDAIITLAEGLLDRDFRSIGRTVKDLGIDADWSLEEIKTYLREGRRA